MLSQEEITSLEEERIDLTNLLSAVTDLNEATPGSRQRRELTTPSNCTTMEDYLDKVIPMVKEKPTKGAGLPYIAAVRKGVRSGLSCSSVKQKTGFLIKIIKNRLKAIKVQLISAGITTIESTEPPTSVATEPPTTVATEPPTSVATEPPTSVATEPPTSVATEPPTSVATEPPTTVTTEPPTTVTTEPPTTVATEPPTTLTTCLLYTSPSPRD